MSDDIKKYEQVHDKKKPFGRPPKYGDEILIQSREYLEGGWKEVGQAIPSIVGLALYLGVVSSTVNKWKTENCKQDFSDICESILDMQHSCLLNNGLTGVFVAPITKMIMTKHGYSDKVDTNHLNDGKPFDNQPMSLDTSKLSTEQLKALKEALNTDENQPT